MSPVLDIQRRMRTLGKIRMGDRGGRGQPQRLTEFRLTSPSRQLVEAAAGLYGGDPRPWEGSPDGEQWEVYTKTDRLPIAIPPSRDPYSQWYELWTGAGCVRRCDGQTAMVATEKQGMRERACLCAQSGDDERECKLTTRVSLMLPDLPSVGVWTLESHGYNAAVELTGTLDLLAMAAAQGVVIEAVLRLEQRSKRVPGRQVSRFVVPVIDLPSLTIGQLIAGEAGVAPAAGRVSAPRGRPALPGTRPALPADATFTDPASVVEDRGEPPARPAPPPPPPAAAAPPRQEPLDPALAGDPGPVERPPLDDDPGWGAPPPPPPTGEASRRGARRAGADERPISEAQKRRMHAIAKSRGVDDAGLRAVVARHTGQESTDCSAITRAAYELICADLEGGA